MKGNIKLIIQNNSNIEEKPVDIEDLNYIKEAHTFFEPHFNDLVCEKCKKESKGKILIELYKNGESAITDFIDFCCEDYNDIARKQLK